MSKQFFPNSTQIPNYFLDEVLLTLSGAELKVMLYLMRRTYGFQKKSDRVSISQICKGIKTKKGVQLDNGTGLNNRTVMKGIASLEEKDLILVEKELGKVNFYKLNLKPVYKNYTSEQNNTSVEKVHYTSVEKATGTSVENVHSQKKVSKESIQKKVYTHFDKFWDFYPKKEDKKKARQIWSKNKLDSQIEEIISFIEKAKHSDRWQKGFIKNPTTFLNSESWNDDINAYNDIKKDESIIRI